MAQPTAWDADCVAIRCALTIDVAERTFKGRASVWVRAPRASSLKLHCRGVTITNVEVNGIKTRWRLRDPVAEVSQTKIQGAGALEAAAWLSAAEEACKSGELEIEVPAKVHLETLPEHDGCDDDFARKARRSCATRLPSMSNIERDDRLVVVEYEGSDGLDFTSNSCMTRCRRGAAPDINGTRCWCPCVDRCDVAHAWRLEITTDLGVACSGIRRPDVDGAHCYEVKGRARSIGFVVGKFAAKERAVRVASVKAALETGRPKLTRVDTDTPSHYRSLGGDAIMRHDSVEIMRDDPITQTPSLERPSIERVNTSEQTPDWIPPTPGRAVSQAVGESSLFVYDERNDVLDSRREKARARAVSSALEACGDAAQFYRAFLKCSGKGHSVVLLDDIPSGTCASFANLTVLKRSLACGLDRVDIGGVGDAVLLALFESLSLQLSCDDDCTLANAIPWYILLKYVERSRGRDACSALTKFMRDDLNASKDPINAGCVGCLALRELDASQGRGVVRDSLRRIASSESWSRDVLQASFTGDVDASFRSLVQNDLSKAVQLGYTYDPQKHLVVCELVGDKHFRGPLSVRVVEAESGWDYEKAVEASKHRWEFGCRSSGGAYASLRQKHGRHHHIAAKALTDDDRKRVQAYDESTKFQRPKIPEGARRRPWRAKRDEPERATDAAEFAQRAVDREEKRKRKRGDKEDSSSSSSSSSEDESDDDRPRRNAVEQEDVLRGARAAKTDPILYVSADPEKARFRSITVAQSAKAWVERLLGSDDAASQLESVDALISTVHGEVEDRLLAARAQRRIKRTTKDHIRIAKMPYAAGYEGFSAASKQKRTRIICTLGPASWSVEMLGVLLDEGMNVARLNFSHGDHAAHAGTIERLKQALAKRPGVHCAIMLDTKGPEIRTGFFDASVGDKLKLTKGSTLILTTDYDHKSTGEKLGCTYKKLSSSVKPGSQILCADGSLVLEVSSIINDTEVACTVLNDCAIGERKNMNLPGVVVDLPVLQEKDTRDLEEFACKQPVDFVAASFVQSADDVRTIRKVLDDGGGKRVKIISKIENQEGLENFESICRETDAVMVARGDLGMEIPPERVFREQKKMIQICNAQGKPVIVATQMLESMTSNPRPTRAECSDVANAVLDGADAVMLSGETAGGNFPKEAVAIMARTCVEAEHELEYTKAYETELALARKKGQFSVVEATVAAAVQAARDARASAVVVLAKTGATAQLFAKYKLSVPLIVVTSDAAVARYAQAVVPGCKPLCLPDCTEYGYAHQSGKDETKMVAEGTKYAASLGIVAGGDDVLLALHSYRVADEKNMAMRFFHASSVL